MRYTFTITDTLYRELVAIIFAKPEHEGAAYILCGVSSTNDETRLLSRRIIPVREEDYLLREADRLSIRSESYVAATKQARQGKEAIIFVHSHPEVYPDFSPQDDEQEPPLMVFFASRISGHAHGSMVFNSTNTFQTRLWVDGRWQAIERVRIVGARFRFVDQVENEDPLPDFFDRQVRAFGPDIQRLLRRLHVGIVGAGGTGSAVFEHLVRLGVGKISIFDPDVLEGSNVTRVHGSGRGDSGKLKTEIQKMHAKQIGLDTVIVPWPSSITEEDTAKQLRDCDIVFGCTDKHSPRGVLSRLSVWYLIPVFDMAVKVHSENQQIRGIWGRVTTLLPGEACLFCRETIDPQTIRAETLPLAQREQELLEGYIPELGTDEPAVVMFTTAVAAQAVNELLHRLTGFMGDDRRSTEVLFFFHEGRLRTNRNPAKPDCWCQQKDHWGQGDGSNFLGRVW